MLMMRLAVVAVSLSLCAPRYVVIPDTQSKFWGHRYERGGDLNRPDLLDGWDRMVRWIRKTHRGSPITAVLHVGDAINHRPNRSCAQIEQECATTPEVWALCPHWREFGEDSWRQFLNNAGSMPVTSARGISGLSPRSGLVSILEDGIPTVIAVGNHDICGHEKLLALPDRYPHLSVASIWPDRAIPDEAKVWAIHDGVLPGRCTPRQRLPEGLQILAGGHYLGSPCVRRVGSTLVAFINYQNVYESTAMLDIRVTGDDLEWKVVEP